MTGATWDIIGILAGGIATLAIFTFLYKENPVYRFFEHMFIGVAVGLTIILNLRQFLWPKAIKPLIGAFATMADNIPYDGPVEKIYLLYIPFMIFGALYYFIYSKKHGWLARLDPARAAAIDEQDRQRILRALEIVLRAGRHVSAIGADVAIGEQFEPTFIGLRWPRGPFQMINRAFRMDTIWKIFSATKNRFQQMIDMTGSG